MIAGDRELFLEQKPYLQPFERELAARELRSLAGLSANLKEENGLWVLRSEAPIELLKNHLTYWQRIGVGNLEPTKQALLEFTQNGADKNAVNISLHKTRRLRYGPHDLHEYRGKFFPQLVKSLINISGIPEDGVILDPMCGSGTTICEAVVSGRTALGSDMNPLSALITEVKSAIPYLDADSFLKTTSRYIGSLEPESADIGAVWPAKDIEYLRLWFDAVAIGELASILVWLKSIRKPLYRKFFQVCLSNIIRSVSWQKETDLRGRKDIQPYEAGTAVARFEEEVGRQIKKIYPYLSVLDGGIREPDVSIRLGDSVAVNEMFSDYKGEVDLIVTSPPYATALPYLDTDRLSLIVLGLLRRSDHKLAESKMIGTREVTEKARRELWDAYEARKSELPKSITRQIEFIASHNHSDKVGFRRRNLPALLGKYYLSMFDALCSARGLMSKGGQAYYVVGNNSTEVDGEKIIIPTDEFLFEIADRAGWTCEEMVPMELLVSRDIFKTNRGSAESILSLSA